MTLQIGQRLVDRQDASWFITIVAQKGSRYVVRYPHGTEQELSPGVIQQYYTAEVE